MKPTPAKQAAILPSRDKLAQLIPPQHQLPFGVFVITEGVLITLGLAGDVFVQRIAVSGIIITCLYFLYRFFPPHHPPQPQNNHDLNTRLVVNQQFPKNVGDEYDNGLALKDSGAYKQAIQHFKRTISLAPDHYKAAYNIAYCSRHLPKPAFETSTTLYTSLAQQLEQPSQSDPELLYLRAHCYIELGTIADLRKRPKEAYDLFHIGLALLPNEPLFYLNLMVVCAKLGMEAEARGWFRRILTRESCDELFRKLPQEDVDVLTQLPWFSMPITTKQLKQ